MNYIFNLNYVSSASSELHAAIFLLFLEIQPYVLLKVLSILRVRYL
jgi:hypothetical protein